MTYNLSRTAYSRGNLAPQGPVTRQKKNLKINGLPMFLVTVGLFVATGPRLSATEISFSFFGVTSGSLNGDAFSGQFELSGTFNTANIQQPVVGGTLGVLGAQTDSAQFALPDGRSMTFRNPTYIFNSPDPTHTGTDQQYLMGFGEGQLPVVVGVPSPYQGDMFAIRGLRHYDLQRDFGPETSEAGLIEANGGTLVIQTSIGDLFLSAGPLPLTLSQSAEVPEPKTLLIGVALLLAIGFSTRRWSFYRVIKR